MKDCAVGLSGEVGECVDMIKKQFYHGKEVNPTDVLYELGDILYYLVAMGNVLGFDFCDIAMKKNVKLMSRYNDGISIEKTNKR